MAYAGASAAAAAPASLTVNARPGQTAKVSAALARSGLKVQRRQGRQLQVVADPSRAKALARIPGVAAARTATASFGDTLAESQGVWRSGADVLGKVAGGGAGLRIAILDLGFGANIPRLQALGEMPPSSRVQSLTFDAASGLAGTNAYGNKTNHGEIVAQTVYDYAPAAQYIFVNYHTEADFLAATDALIALHPDIVVHSNSFIEGPFDGTGPLARAVDRAADSGILWFNSAGNYALTHWEGPWVDADGDDDLDWPNGDNWTFARPAGQPITFGLSWTSPPGGPPTDLDLILERQEADGTWSPAMGSTDRQSAGLPTSERITGYSPFADGVFRIRVVRFSGPPPVGPITLFSREIPMAAIGGTAASSIPTPGDAAGSITVGAADWRGNALKNYSSQGPTDDGRLKPDISAPTNTQIMGPNGFRGVGGTSNSAPNAAGAAAVLLAASRRAGGNPTAAEVRAQLLGLALDLGAPGPDDAYGWGRVRVSSDPPRLTKQTPAALASVRNRVTVKFSAITRSRITGYWSLTIDGTPATARPQTYPRGITVDTRRLTPGWHLLHAQVADAPGNLGASDWSVYVDNTAPTLAIRTVTQAKKKVAKKRDVRLTVAAKDLVGVGKLTATATIRTPSGRKLATKVTRFAPGPLRVVPLGRLATGRYVVRLDVADRAGNLVTRTRRIAVR